MSEHADLEALSAYVDGEAPEWAGHVVACPVCRATVEQLRDVAAAVRAPVDPAPAARRDAAVAAAVGSWGDDAEHAAHRARFARRRSQWRWTVPAAAAAVAAVLGVSALVALDRRSPDSTTLAGPALESTPPAVPGVTGDVSATGAPPPADLGDVPDAATLLARTRAVGATAVAGGRAAPGNRGVASEAPPPPNPAPTLQPSPMAAVPNVVGTRPCEEQARAREPSLREVVFFATARRGQVPAVVLGFATGPSPGPVTLLLLRQEGCAELLRAAGP